MRQIFSANLARAMQAAHINGSDLARAVWGEERTDKNGYAQPVGKDRISAYINGRVLPTEATLAKIADALGMPREALLADSGADLQSPAPHLNGEPVFTVTPHGPTSLVQLGAPVKSSDVIAFLNALKAVTDQFAVQAP